MKRTLTLLLAGLILFPTQAARRIGEALVRADANGQPCFTISEREEARSGTPDFQAITVSEGERVLWRMTMPRDRTFPVSASMCIPYGGRVPALPQTPALPLGDQTIYTVRIGVQARKDVGMPQLYQARFCLPRQAGSGQGPRQPGRDHTAGYDPGACRP